MWSRPADTERWLPRYRKVFVLVPADAVTGGPEALHQLVDAIRREGGEAFVSYYPLGTLAETAEAYRRYDIVQADPEDAPGNLIVTPESQPLMPRRFVRAATAIWWLSVDNFLHGKDRPGWDEVRARINFAQSRYAADFLERHGIASAPLTDYLNDEFLRPPPRKKRQDAIAYNFKSRKIVERLKSASPALEALTWIEIADRSRAEVRRLLSEVKIFVDFGHHPGRDRMLREAVLCGACVLTGLRGSASFAEDVPLPARFKLDESDPHFPANCDAAIGSILRGFRRHAWNLRGYRRFAASGQEMFRREVRDAFFRHAAGQLHQNA